MTQLLRVQNFTVSSDGFGAGDGQTLERPFGHANPVVIFNWAGATASWPSGPTPEGLAGWTTTSPVTSRTTSAPRSWDETSLSSAGAWENLEWAGWWGDVPPFHTPVFVLTHHARPSFTLADTTFHFLEASPAEALEQTKESAHGKDVRFGGGATIIREFLDADLVDTLHVVVAPLVIGRGERLWTSPDDLIDRFHLEAVPSASGVTHHLFWRR